MRMPHRSWIPLLSLALGLTVAAPARAANPHHALQVRLDPAGHRLEVADTLTLDGVTADADGTFHFVLHAGLDPTVVTPGWALEAVDGPVDAAFLGINATSETAGKVPLEGYRLHPPGHGATGPVEIRYAGVVDHPLATSGEEYQRSFSETPGIIGPDGVFLAGSTAWVPTFGDGLVTFTLTVGGLTPPWDVVSQGGRTRHETAPDGTRTTTWECTSPQEEVYLVAGPWHEYSATAGKTTLHAFLRQDDPALADRYLKATRRHLKLYESMLPPFPYPSFALVENFWETGYGMPGFTLLGPRVIRFPWILTSSYPHELLHNWWGNSAYVDFATGNWCEGLTAYMADHLFAEQKGRGAVYRRATLKKYTDFAKGDKDFPLSQFHSRFSAASEAVGYGKSLMLFHMVRRAVGNETFLQAMSRFWESEKFTRASFADIARAVSETSGGDWNHFFETWVNRVGAPRLEIVSVTATETPDSPDHPWEVHLELRQVHEGDPWPMSVPVAVTVEGREEAIMAEVGTCLASCALTIPCPSRPLRVDVDPAFDVMRRLDPLEVPPALSTLFGSKDATFVLPSGAPPAELEAWKALAAHWAAPGEPRMVLDSEAPALPGGSVWVLGRSNRFAPEVARRVAAQGVTLEKDAVTVAGKRFGLDAPSVVLVARADDPSAALGWVAAAPAGAIGALARKLPHYTRYSWLAFTGEDADNTGKGMWKPLESPLVRNLTDGPLPELRLPEREPLAQLPPAFDAAAMKATVDHLAAPGMEGRGVGTPQLERATAWVEARLRDAGLEPAGTEGYRQSWSWTGGDPPHEITLTNLLARIPGTDPALADHPVLVMAHLDHLGHGWPDVRPGNEGKIHPGADDNASGVAVLLELARTMAAEPRRPRPVLFAVVTAEEAGLVGSRHLMASLPPEKLPYACVNLDTVGRLSEGKLHVLNTDSAKEWKFLWMGVGHTTGAPVAIVPEPLDASDQGACLERGVPAVQLFSGPTTDYHKPTDTPDKIDADGMAVVAEAAHEAVAYLAERTEPLTVTIGPARPAPPAGGPPPRPGGRRAGIGTVPDFAFGGPGVRVDRVVPGSPAEAAGLAAGDVITAMDGKAVGGLRDYSRLLKGHQPGDTVTLTVLRDGVEKKVEVTLGER